jgi:hypothetical protein
MEVFHIQICYTYFKICSCFLKTERQTADKYIGKRRNTYLRSVASQVSGSIFEVFMAIKMVTLVFWIVTPCGLVRRYQCFGGKTITFFTAEVNIDKFQNRFSYKCLSSQLIYVTKMSMSWYSVSSSVPTLYLRYL